MEKQELVEACGRNRNIVNTLHAILASTTSVDNRTPIYGWKEGHPNYMFLRLHSGKPCGKAGDKAWKDRGW